MKTLLVIDGNSILNRAFYGIRPLTTQSGLPTNAVYGFITMLKKHIDALTPDSMVCAFDRREPTFRHRMYTAYKATRKGMPEELAMQLPYAKDVAAALGCRVLSLSGYEADDILGTVSAMADQAGDTHTYILTGDRDSLQLVSERTSVILVKTKEDILYTPERFREEYGVEPIRLIDIKALMGDSSDNIPGVPGIGEKTALKLIAESGSLDTLYGDLDAWKLTASVRAKLEAGRESAALSATLATICRTAPIPEEQSPCVMDPAKLSALFTELEFFALRSRFQLDDAEVKSDKARFTVPAYAACPADFAADAPLAVALGTEGEIYLASENFHYVLPAGETARLPETVAGNPVYCHDYKKLCAALSPRGIRIPCAMDTMLAAYLLTPGESAYPIDKIAFRHLHLDTAESGAAAEAELAYLLTPPLAEEVEKQGMTALLAEIEIPLAEVLADMEAAGFRLDAEGLHRYISSLEAAAAEIAARIYDAAGVEFNLNSPKQLGEILFEKLGLPAGKKTRTGYATDAETLQKLRPYHAIVGDILDYRQLVKLCGTYGDNLIALMREDGKIHSRFNQTGTATGRLSSADPNMQNIPVRGQLGRELRRFFTASDGDHVLLDADYSQIELRLLAAISGDENMCRAFLTGEDIHRSTAARVFHVPLEMVTPEERLRAKAVNFGIVYGIGDYSLSQDLGISRRQAGEYIRGYLDTYPAVDAYLHGAVESAKELGFTATLYGRRRYIPELAAKNANLRAFGERVAMNSPIQGTAADIIKIAMVRTYRALCEAGIDARLILQVHDELIVEASRADAERAAEILRREMEGAASLAVPLSTEVSSGATWYDAKQ